MAFALWGGGGVPTAAGLVDGGRRRALVAGEGWVCLLGVREGLAWREGLGAGSKGFDSGGVGGRGTGPRDGANFATCVVFLSFLTRTKRRKIAFFEGCPVGWIGVPTGAGLVDGGGRPRALVAGEGLGGGGRRGWMEFQRRGRVGAWLAVPKRGKSREGLACLAVPQEGARARGGIQGLRFRKGRCVVFRKLEG